MSDPKPIQADLVSDDAAQSIAAADHVLAHDCQTRLAQAGQLVAELETDWESGLLRHIDFVRDIAHARERLLGITHSEPLPLTSHSLRLQISTLFACECWEYLIGDPSRSERMHLVTGTVTPDGHRIMSRMERLKFSNQSAAYVRAERDDTHQRLVALTETHGHPVLAMFHSHISKGARATTPSETDISNQKRFEQLGCEAIGGIFSLDCYVRFFSTMKPFELSMYGNGAECISDAPMEKVFKLPVPAET